MAAFVKYKILNGPSKEVLKIGLFDGDHKHRQFLTFSVVQNNNTPQPSKNIVNYKLTAVINEIARNDGSGHKWTIKGLFTSVVVKGSGYGQYCTKTGKGWLKLRIA